MNSTDEKLQTVESMVAHMEPSTYCKCMLELASEYLQIHADEHMCMELLNRCPPSYFEGAFLKHYEEDLVFQGVMQVFLYKIFQLGIIQSYAHTPNQSEGRA